MREEIVGWDQDTLVRLLWGGDVLDVEVLAVVPEESIAGWRNRVRNSWKALRGRPGPEGFDLTSEADYRRLGYAIEALIPLERAGSTEALTRAGPLSTGSSRRGAGRDVPCPFARTRPIGATRGGSRST
jgi:hypothetical protein